MWTASKVYRCSWVRHQTARGWFQERLFRNLSRWPAAPLVFLRSSGLWFVIALLELVAGLISFSVRYWLHAMQLTEAIIPLPYSECLLTSAEFSNVSPVTYKDGGLW